MDMIIIFKLKVSPRFIKAFVTKVGVDVDYLSTIIIIILFINITTIILLLLLLF